MNEYVLETKKICKSYYKNEVLKDIDFTLKHGTIHALLGANGAGKSTLMKILSGGEVADSGEIIIEGSSYNKLTPVTAREAGVGIVHQEFAQCLDMSVIDNIYLGRELSDRSGFVKKQRRLAEWKNC